MAFLLGVRLITNPRDKKFIRMEIIHDISISIRFDSVYGLIEKSIDQIFSPALVERYNPTPESVRYTINHPKHGEIGEINLLIGRSDSSLLNIKVYHQPVLGIFSYQREMTRENFMNDYSGVFLSRLRSELIELGTEIGEKDPSKTINQKENNGEAPPRVTDQALAVESTNGDQLILKQAGKQQIAPKRLADLNKWKAIWYYIENKHWQKMGMSPAKIREYLEKDRDRHAYFGPVVSVETIKKIINAGNAGELS